MSTALPRTLAALLASAALLLAACGDDAQPEASDPASAADPTSESPTTDTDAGDDATQGGACEYPTAGDPAVEGVEPPPEEPSVSGDVAATLTTSVGEFGLTLDAEGTPCTVNSFVSLVEQDYFDGTQCHRLTDYKASGGQAGLKVLQCGDPTGSGAGGPGYTIPDELTGEETYPAGTLAMAKTSMPDSGGSQFFIVYDDSALPPDYTVFGTVDRATIRAVADVAKDGSNPPTDGAPNTTVTVEEASVTP
ncbi:peptidylprolyl isomerase [Nocardioides panacisoli]|uniref:peptidylprolyl isomerase n=1 Tax=Nocardioides panacisoli TaxID=627624 RepID=UPI001C631CCD|nr:peptidylprolyl isomerase [Nocardioides panacisoli]QYJ05111.1 peptidylprolyl isomerase [Nocardioides panacisoli]